MSKTRYLPDVHVLLALTIRGHEFYSIATKWFEARGSSECLLCPLTETSFLRLSTEPKVGNKQLRDAIFLLREFSTLPGFRYRPIPDSWLNLTAPFIWRLHGHKQSDRCAFAGFGRSRKRDVGYARYTHSGMGCAGLQQTPSHFVWACVKRWLWPGNEGSMSVHNRTLVPQT